MAPNHSPANANSQKSRLRAAKACKRCSQRKVKFDAIKNGLPCSRCRMDNHDDCALILSRRGTYDRKGSLRQIHHRRVEDPSLATESHPAPPNSEAVENNQSINEQTHIAKTPIDIQDNSPDLNSPLSMMSPQHVSRNPAAANTASGSEASDASNDLSLAAQFEDFLNWRSQNNGRPHGLILLGEPSPLTFALEELSENSSPQLHNASEHIRDSSNLEVLQQDIYPPHLDTADIAYLKAKGAFGFPRRGRSTIWSRHI